jgi:hypothetical protein
MPGEGQNVKLKMGTTSSIKRPEYETKTNINVSVTFNILMKRKDSGRLTNLTTNSVKVGGIKMAPNIAVLIQKRAVSCTLDDCQKKYPKAQSATLKAKKAKCLFTLLFGFLKYVRAATKRLARKLMKPETT